MNAERIRLFVEALRSGEYTQATGWVGRIDRNGIERNCASGVMCRVALANGLDVERTVDPYVWSDGSRQVDYDGTPIAPSDKVLGWFGLRDMVFPFRDRQDGRIGLIGLNDRGFTFDQLADLVEHFWLPREAGDDV